MLTCYDASFASLMDRCGVEVLLIGDSLGMVCNGHNSTLPVTVAEVAYHIRVMAAAKRKSICKLWKTKWSQVGTGEFLPGR